MEAVTARIEGLNGFVDESLDEIEKRIAALHTSWSGEAAAAHAAAHLEWTTAAGKIRDGLAKMRAAATAARQQYESASAANLSMLGRGTGAAG
ncbi:WXG100 family type VII secretion target [Nocardia sp. R6R-6]|uniref:WXG100 family type VII secretion target n=1 Tax=Nocardia sp. R6R-6 TaxID=3459303 RepID=UPI00403D897F